MRHVMIDLETFDTGPRAAIISIGACFFDPETGEIGDKFHIGIDWNDAIKRGTVSGDTLRWWFAQEPSAIERLLNLPTVPVETALRDLSNFCGWANPYVWGNGSTFDITILENAYGRDQAPWKFWNTRDVRTVVHMARGILEKDQISFEGVQHDALDDAIYQAKYVSEMWQVLR